MLEYYIDAYRVKINTFVIYKLLNPFDIKEDSSVMAKGFQKWL